RKEKSEYLKKKMRSIYIDDLLYEKINHLYADSNISFSQKCSYILNDYFEGQEPSKQEKSNENNEITFIDLFAGIGGIRQGFEDQNTICVFSSEWDAFAQKTYEANFGEKPVGDITLVREDEVPPHDVL